MTEVRRPRRSRHRPITGPAFRVGGAVSSSRTRRTDPALEPTAEFPLFPTSDDLVDAEDTADDSAVDTDIFVEPEVDLIEAARSGDQLAFAQLYRDTQSRLLRYAATLVGQDAEDVTGEAWLQIARDLHRFSGDMTAFRGWAATIVRNRALDLLRANARRPATSVEAISLELASELDTAGTAAERMSTAAALALIATLPRDQAEAVLLRVVVGLDAKTAGAVLGKRAGAVRVASHRGLKALGRLLDRPAGER
jgi:RNA polymerase sigma-70 factor (ECF subfamily)